MSEVRTQAWLEAYREKSQKSGLRQRTAKVISFTGGKGGVGKTSMAIKFAHTFAGEGFKTLLIDCDSNLSNTGIKIGLSLNTNFLDLISNQKSFDDCLYKNGLFHLLQGCNGNLELINKKFHIEGIIVDIIEAHKNDYDFIIIDCPAGLQSSILTLNAYSDYRFMVVTPDKSSITDTYSLIKILKTNYGVQENHLLANKISHAGEYRKVIKSLSETAETFLNCRTKVLGGVRKVDIKSDEFDGELMRGEKSALHQAVLKIIKSFTDELVGPLTELQIATRVANEQNVHIQT